MTTRLGKILRINADGTIPTDNPFYKTTSGANRSIWALGLRNPYNFAFDPTDGRMNINDVGAGGPEEVNRGKAGANYGWPSCEGACSRSGYTNPIHSYAHKGSSAITGATFNRGNNFPASYRGDYFFGDYLKGFIKRLKPNGQVSDFHTTAKSPVDMAIGPNGKLYYISIGTGKLYRVSYAP
jgi:glucose/arabinose dehydrogenase